MGRDKWVFIVVASALPAALAAVYWVFPELAGRMFLSAMAPSYQVPQVAPLVGSDPNPAGPEAESPGAPVRLRKVGSGFRQPTDVQFPPGLAGYAVVLEKGGTAKWLDLKSGDSGALLTVPAVSVVEQGLLGLAFHPHFQDNRTFFLNYTLEVDGWDTSRVERWRLTDPLELSEAKAEPAGVIMELVQPYQNHNGGGLAFGPDGYLYIGWGDGGLRDDPRKAGQDTLTWLGKMLRVDVDRKDPTRAYAIPPDNPFVGDTAYLPEIWAYGLRNPWRYSFAPDGRLIVADVGQDRIEEIGFAPRGANLGWALREGDACFPIERDCSDDPATEPPFHTYGRKEGSSITGGHVYTGASLPALRGKYVFGDFVSRHLWAVTVPDGPDEQVSVSDLGVWPILPSSFGRDGSGEIYVTDFARGDVYRLDSPEPAAGDEDAGVADGGATDPGEQAAKP